MKQTKGYLATILSAVAYGSAPLMITMIYGSGFGVNSVSFLRVLFPVPILAIIVLFRKGESFALSGKKLLQIVLLGITGTVLTSMFLFRSYRHIDTGTATALHFSYPVLVILLDMILYKQKPGKHLWTALVLCFAGILMFISPGGAFSWKGLFLALGSSVSFALYVLFLDRSRILEDMPFYSFTFWFFLVSSVLMLPIALLSGELGRKTELVGWLMIIVFATYDGLLATMFQEYGVNTIGGRAASIISAMEPVTSAVLGVLVLSEEVRIRNIIGIALIIAATIYLILRDNRDGGQKDGLPTGNSGRNPNT